MKKNVENLFAELLEEIKQEEREAEQRRQKILAEGCTCEEKIECIGTISKIKFLECPICHKQFTLDGEPINLN